MKEKFFKMYYKSLHRFAIHIKTVNSTGDNLEGTKNCKVCFDAKGEIEDSKFSHWIKEQMKYRSCTVVLVGKDTANRKWINYEIVESWNSGMGVVGIHIYGLKDNDGYITTKGDNPFDYIDYGDDGAKLSSIVKCYTPGGNNSKERYEWISKYLSAAVGEAIKIRGNN